MGTHNEIVSYVSGGTEQRRMESARELSEVTAFSFLPATSFSSSRAPCTATLPFVVTHPPLPLAETKRSQIFCLARR